MNDAATLTFLGAAGTVTGSRFLIKTAGKQILLDAGLFQGLKNLRLRNWSDPPFDAASLDAVVISHAHIDHSGYLPLLARRGFRGPVYCTSATADLLSIMLPDSAHLQEEEAAFANKKGYSKHKPALPLYTAADAQAALRLIAAKSYHKPFDVAGTVRGRFYRAGHILGSAIIELEIPNASGTAHKLVFSGDLGRWHQPILLDPEFVGEADTLLVESTYGSRVHPEGPKAQLAGIVKDIFQNGGVLVVPAFAVGRTQELLWLLRELEDEGAIPALPVYMDSPMAINASVHYANHGEEHDLAMTQLLDERRSPLGTKRLQIVRSVEDSRKLHKKKGPMILLSASGMATGGRVLHHLVRRLPDPENIVLLTGYQAKGTRGRLLEEGAETVRIFGEDVSVRARIEKLQGVSAHADQNDILKWLSGFTRPPRQTYLVHGEAEAAAGLAEAIRSKLGWTVHVALDGQTIGLELP